MGNRISFSPGITTASPGTSGGSRSRAGSAGREGHSRGVVRRPVRSRPRVSRLHRRDGGRNQHGPPLRPRPAWRALPSCRTAQPLQNHDRHRRPAGQWLHRHGPVRWGHERPMVPSLRHRDSAPALKHGDIVVLDNLATHKGTGVREAMEAVGAHLLYISAHSPDFNPIEMAFSKLKSLLWSAAA